MNDTEKARSGLICFSGGCDSTYLLYERCQDASPKNPVRSIAFNHPQISGKEQKKARKKILAEFKKRGWWVNHLEVNIDLDGSFYAHECRPSQPIVWVTQGVMYLQDDEDLVLGFLTHEDIWKIRPDLEASFNHMQKAAGKTGLLQFPYEDHEKYFIVEELKKLKLLDLTWWCNFPENGGKACGRCNSCIHHDAEIHRGKLRKKRENIDLKPIAEKLAKKKKIRRKKR